MALIGGDMLGSLLSGYRIAWVAGRVGSYKSSLSLWLARPFLEKGYRLVSNMQCVWNDDPTKIDFVDEWGHLKVVVIIDEGGGELQFGRQVMDIMRYPRKMDVVLIIPSFWPPALAGRTLTVQGMWNTVSAGLPMVVYKWKIRLQDFKDNGHVIWTFPQDSFGIYSSQSPGFDAGYIVEWLGLKTEEYVDKYAQKAPEWIENVRSQVKAKRGAKSVPTMDDRESTYGGFESLTEASENFASASYDLETLFTRGRTGKRF